MKTKKFVLLAFVCFFTFSSCSVQTPLSQSRVNPVLKESANWTADTLRNDLVWYKYSSSTDQEFAHQNVNVISFDTHSSASKAFVSYHKTKDSLSAIAGREGALAGINATYFLEGNDTVNYMYLRLKGKEIQTVEVPDSNIFYWKHEGMLTYDDKSRNFSIGYSPKDFSKLKAANVLTGAPVLIDHFKPVGTAFADTAGVDLSKLLYEHPLKHQGIRHPRTAVALTADGHLLLITVDGRNANAKGISARELTLFLKRFFNPVSALNIDGGGSTTMWVKGQPFNGIVNYPTDNKKFDHFGQRKVETVLLIK